ncbi:hypothetical protein EYF80_038539 [Liparis tanakae]|uniref:Uncharacterized protein n=1 Tax=Liparis tanakae TaxID=230148 RepID=A0A4Z2GCJ8_9TELE|nr:hypothetical protein EYF80_038539 [Liparis tanakae]
MDERRARDGQTVNFAPSDDSQATYLQGVLLPAAQSFKRCLVLHQRLVALHTLSPLHVSVGPHGQTGCFMNEAFPRSLQSGEVLVGEREGNLVLLIFLPPFVILEL